MWKRTQLTAKKNALRDAEPNAFPQIRDCEKLNTWKYRAPAIPVPATADRHGIREEMIQNG